MYREAVAKVEIDTSSMWQLSFFSVLDLHSDFLQFTDDCCCRNWFFDVWVWQWFVWLFWSMIAVHLEARSCNDNWAIDVCHVTSISCFLSIGIWRPLSNSILWIHMIRNITCLISSLWSPMRIWCFADLVLVIWFRSRARLFECSLFERLNRLNRLICVINIWKSHAQSIDHINIQSVQFNLGVVTNR